MKTLDSFQLVRDLASRYPDCDSQGPLLPLNKKVSAASKRLAKLVDSLNGDSCFIPYRESFRFAEVLHAALDRIEDEIIPSDPEEGLWLVAMFIETDLRIIAHGDDSGGAMAEAYYRACGLFATIAKKLENPNYARELFFRLIACTDYGTRDLLFDCANQILSPAVVKHVIEVWLARLEQLDTEERWGLSIRLGQLAKSIGDSLLYERIRMEGRDPREYLLVAFDVARCHLECGNPEEALVMLSFEGIEGRFMSERNELLAKAYEALGREDKLREVFLKEFHNTGYSNKATRLIEMAPEVEKQSLRAELDQFVLKSALDPTRQAGYFVEMGDLNTAEQVIVSNHSAFNGDFYDTLLQLAEPLKENHPLAASVLYRATMESVLNRAISKYYPHAVRYYKYLKKLNPRIKDWKGIEDHLTYWRTIETKHERKSAFWRRIE